MRLEIALNPANYGADATSEQAAAAIQWFRQLAELLGMEWCYDALTGTDGAHEAWSDDGDKINSDDVSETAYDHWCSGMTPEQAAAAMKK